MEPIGIYCFSCQPWSLNMSNTTKLTFCLLFEAHQVLFKIYLKVSSFWLKPCSPCEYSFGTLVWFETRLFHWSRLTFIPFPLEHKLLILKLASLQQIPVGRWVVSLKQCQFFQLSADSFGKADFWRLAKKKKKRESFQPDSTGTKISPLDLMGFACQPFELNHVCCRLFENSSLLWRKRL